jgi:hypothetical protein
MPSLNKNAQPLSLTNEQKNTTKLRMFTESFNVHMEVVIKNEPRPRHRHPEMETRRDFEYECALCPKYSTHDYGHSCCLNRDTQIRRKTSRRERYRESNQLNRENFKNKIKTRGNFYGNKKEYKS